jgi:hypothetical protein
MYLHQELFLQEVQLKEKIQGHYIGKFLSVLQGVTDISAASTVSWWE